jgi:hypothetical protein
MRSFALGYSSYFPNPYYAITTGNTQQAAKAYDLAGRGYGALYFGAAFVVAIVSSTNASPIVITVASTTGIFASGDSVIVAGHTVNTAANNTPSNPTWTLGTVTGTTVALTGSTGNGVGGATGVIYNTTRFNRSPIIPARLAGHARLLPTFGQPNGT